MMLARIIKLESSGKDRNRLTHSVVVAIRELMSQEDINNTTRDLAAYISISLKMISESIDLSVNAWEKRGYWIKADRFRLKWSWTEQLGDQMRQAVIEEDWGRVAEISVKIADRVKDVNVSQRHRLGKPWVGAWKKLQTERK